MERYSAQISLSEINYVRLSRIYDLSRFDCDDADINDFIRNDANQHQDAMIATTTLFLHKEKILGFCSLAADAIVLSQPERRTIADAGPMKHYPQYPAIKLVRFGRDKSFSGQGIGKDVIIPWVIGYAKSLSGVAVRFITVDAYPERVEYYKALRFVENQHERYKKSDGNPISMRLDLKLL